MKRSGKEMGALAADLLWEELQAGRRRVRVECGLLLPDDHLAMTAYVLRRRLSVSALLQQCIYHYCLPGAAISLPGANRVSLEEYGIRTYSVLLRHELRSSSPDLILILFALQYLPTPYREKMTNLWAACLLGKSALKDKPGRSADTVCAGAGKTGSYQRFSRLS